MTSNKLPQSNGQFHLRSTLRAFPSTKIPSHACDLREVQLEITAMCNADCPFCINRSTFAGEGRTTNGLPTQTLHRVIDWIADAGIKRIRFTGGEPLIRKDLFDLVAHAKDRNMITIINTNGFLVNRYLHQLYELVDVVLLSIISTSPRRTDQVMDAPGSHAAKVQALQLLREHPGVWTSTVLSKESVDELEQLYLFMKQHAVNYWILLRPEDNGKNDTGYGFDELVLATLIEKVRKIEQEYNEIIGIGNAIPVCACDPDYLSRLVDKSDGGFVSEGRSKLVINPYGQVLTHYGIGLPIGQIFDDFNKLWNHPFAKRLRSLDILPEECKRCSYLSICYGGSRLAAKAAYGSFEKPDPLMHPENLPQGLNSLRKIE